MSRLREYEELKVQKVRLYNRVWLLSVPAAIGVLIGIVLFDNTVEQGGSLPILLCVISSLIFIILMWRAQSKYDEVKARVKAMEHGNFSESYFQQDISMRQGSVQGYSSTPVTKTASIETELQKLNDLRARDVINDDEYAKMRAKLFE